MRKLNTGLFCINNYQSGIVDFSLNVNILEFVIIMVVWRKIVATQR